MAPEAPLETEGRKGSRASEGQLEPSELQGEPSGKRDLRDQRDLLGSQASRASQESQDGWENWGRLEDMEKRETEAKRGTKVNRAKWG